MGDRPGDGAGELGWTSPACAPQDANSGDLSCPAYWGVAWTGISCEGVSGCNCNGADCFSLYPDRETCESAHASCLLDGG